MKWPQIKQLDEFPQDETNASVSIYSCIANDADLEENIKMDISFRVNNEKFNFRVCAVIISDNRILAMHDERSPYFYLPGGRVEIGVTAEHAVVREVQEELCVTPKIIRPLWL